MALEPITRAEQIMSGEILEPITREEMFLAKAAGMDVTTPEPITRREMFLSQISGGGGGATINNQDKTITQNGTYTADEGYTGLGNVTVNVESSGGSEIEEQWRRHIEQDESKPVTKIPDGVTIIGKRTFYECKNVLLSSLPDSLKIIGDYAFAYCSNLSLAYLPPDVTSIGTGAFRGCTNITTMTLPPALKTVCANAFTSCIALNEVTFTAKPESIFSTVFTECTNTLTINVPWSEGEVSGAPWGATNATINYNYTGG